jgi:RNA polymerase sigma factor (sigma-70 family)
MRVAAMSVIAPHQQHPSVADIADARLADLHGRHGRHVLRYCRKRTGSDVEADDAFQLTFVHAMRGLRSGVVPQYELAWLLAIARNVCREHWRTYQRRPHLVDDLDAVADNRPLSDADRSLVLDLDAALAQLSEKHRTAILLREWRGLNYAEIAVQMGLTESAVETMLVRARRELATALEQGAEPRKRRASWRDLGWLADLARRIASRGAAAKLLAGAAVVTVTVGAGGASPTGSDIRGATNASPTAAQIQPGGVRAGDRTRRDPRLRTGAAVTARHAGSITFTRPGLPHVLPVAPTRTDGTTPTPPAKTEPTENAPPASPVQVPPTTLTVPVLSAQAPTLTVTVPTVDLPDPLPPTPAVAVTTPTVDIETPTITVQLPGVGGR